MTARRMISVYSDYKSPYAYLAKDLIYALETDCGATVDWKPYILDIPLYLGSARVDAAGNVLEENRNAHQWRRVRYSYMDCRRQARKQGLIIRGTEKIWDSTLAAAGMLFARRQDPAVFRRYHDTVFERFWRRDLDIESVPAIAALLHEVGADASGFPSWAETGRARWPEFPGRLRPWGCSGCRVLSWMASSIGGGSICRRSGGFSPLHRSAGRSNGRNSTDW